MIAGFEHCHVQHSGTFSKFPESYDWWNFAVQKNNENEGNYNPGHYPISDKVTFFYISGVIFPTEVAAVLQSQEKGVSDTDGKDKRKVSW